jgi:gliding motility-associated-like protein
MRLLSTALFLALTLGGVHAQPICNANGNLLVYSNYDGGSLTINVDQNIPDQRIGICTYRSVAVTITGPFAGNVTEVIYAGYDQPNNTCGSAPPNTTITGVPAGIVSAYSPTTGNTAVTNFLGEVTQAVPGVNLVNCMIGAEGFCSASATGGANSSAQIVQFFLAEFGPGTVLRSHQTQSGCFGSASFNVSAGGNCCITETNTPPNPVYVGNGAYDVFALSDTLLCDGALTLDASFYPGGYTTNWSTGSTADAITITEPGTYVVSIPGYCIQLVDTVVVLDCCVLGEVGTQVTSISCAAAGDGAISVTPLGTGPFTFSWNTVPPQATPSLSGLESGTYTLSLTSAAGVDSTLTFTLTQPQPLTVDVFGFSPICAQAPGLGTALTSGGTAPVSIAWNTGGSGIEIPYTFAASGPLIATVTDANGCTTSDTLHVQVEQPPSSAFTLSTDTICSGGEVVLVAAAADADSLSWTLGSAGAASGAQVAVSYTVPGNEVITLVAIGPNGCASAPTSATLRVAPLPQLDLLAEPVPCERAFQVVRSVSDADDCTLWLDGVLVDMSCSAGLELDVPDEGDYELVLVASNSEGCADTLARTVTIQDTPGLFVPNAFTPDADGINDLFTIGPVAHVPGMVLRIFDRWGTEIFTTSDLSKGWDGTVGGAEVLQGVYPFLLRAPDPFEPNTLVERRGHLTVLR